MRVGANDVAAVVPKSKAGLPRSKYSRRIEREAEYPHYFDALFRRGTSIFAAYSGRTYSNI